MIAQPHSLFDFGPLAAEYERWYHTPAGRSHDGYQKALVQRILLPAGPRERLLEIGCGTGNWSRFFALLGYTVLGVDISKSMIEVAKAHPSPQCRFEVADACNLPFASDTFEVVAAMATLEFVSDGPRALAEMFRCTSPSGRILIGTLNRLAPMNQRRVAEGKEPYASARLYSPDELRELLEQYGHVQINVTAEASIGALIVAEVRP